LASVPSASRPAPSTESYDLTRQSVGDQSTLTVIARKALKSITIEVFAPDGRSASQTRSD